jgi:hypothetical protein
MGMNENVDILVCHPDVGINKTLEAQASSIWDAPGARAFKNIHRTVIVVDRCGSERPPIASTT